MPPRRESRPTVGQIVAYIGPDGRSRHPAIVVEVTGDAVALQVFRTTGSGTILREGVTHEPAGAAGTWQPL